MAPARLCILYGSQTGTAEEVAWDLQRQLELERSYRVTCQSMDSFDVTTLPRETFAIFITATTGQGDPPDNMRKFWRFLLRRNLPSNSLDHLNFAVFGLGDSSYPKYNTAARKLFKRLSDLGARALVPIGLGDDQNPKGGLFFGLDQWLSGLLPKLEDYKGSLLDPALASLGEKIRGEGKGKEKKKREWAKLLQVRKVSAPADRLKYFNLQYESNLCYRTLVNKLQAPIETNPDGQGFNASEYHRGKPYFAKLSVNKRMTSPDHFQDVRRLQYDLNPRMTYAPGDALAVLPMQQPSLLHELLQRLGCSYDDWVEIKSNRLAETETGTGDFHVKKEERKTSREEEASATGNDTDVVHLGTLFHYCLDGTSASPKRYFFEIASLFSEDELEREKLIEFSSREGRDDLYEYCTREKRSLLECLQDFPSVRLPLDWAIQLCPKLQPRQFSISSACHSIQQNDQRSEQAAAALYQNGTGSRGTPCELTVAVVSYKTPWKRSIEGLCSNYLKDLPIAGADHSGDEDEDEEGSPNQKERSQNRNGNRNLTTITSPVWIEKGSLKFDILHSFGVSSVGSGSGLGPSNPESAIVIGPGTGIAPFKSLADQLVHGHTGKEFIGGDGDGDGDGDGRRLLVFFGCRNKEKDYLHGTFWETLVRESEVFQYPGGFVSAFSRDKKAEKRSHNKARGEGFDMQVLEKNEEESKFFPFSTSNKYYVQDAIAACSAQVYEMIHLKGARVYVAGSTGQMPKDVRSALAHVMVKHGNLLHNQAETYLKNMEKNKKYQVECWA